MKDYLLNFEDYLKNKKKTSDNTLESYLRDVGQFVLFCDNSGIKDLKDVTSSNVTSYVKYLEKQKKAVSTISRAIASIRCYFQYLESCDIVDKNPANAVKLNKTEKKFPEILTSNEVTKILSQPDGNDYKSYRDKAMLQVLYATGIKVSELVSLTINDVNVQIGIINLRSQKGQRIIPLYPDALKSLKDYLLVRDAIALEDEQALFTNMNGTLLTRQGFWKILKYYVQKANIKKDITPHTIRHSFAAHLLQNGAPLSDIKEMLGHADISSTQIYAQMMKNKYSQSYKKFHPLAK